MTIRNRTLINLIFIIVTTFPYIFCAHITGKPWFFLGTFVWLFMPCTDPNFGNGKKYFWLRQLTYIVASAASILLSMY